MVEHYCEHSGHLEKLTRLC